MAQLSTSTVVERSSETPTEARFPVWRSVAVVLLIGLTLFVCHLFRQIDTESKAGVVMDLPSNVGNYLGFDEEVTDSEKVILPKDTEFAKKHYVGFGSEDITTEIVLSGAQRQSIHRPQVCLIGQGWTIQREQSLPIKLKDSKTQNVRMLTLLRPSSTGPIKGYFIYWFVGEDKTTDDHVKRIFLTSWDRIVHRINHRWAYVIVSSTIPPSPKGLEPKEEKVYSDLVKFTQEIIPKIQKPDVVPG
ncbi:MAG: exosortase-associated EpsI family protein [Verrucomicrobia bacterium]|nr:exosortase-associated EpsI family protein [Verrucomicrobiota bacterium]